jgi:hypothetical protein
MVERWQRVILSKEEVAANPSLVAENDLMPPFYQRLGAGRAALDAGSMPQLLGRVGVPAGVRTSQMLE